MPRIGSLIRRLAKQPLCNHWSPAGWKPNIQRVDQAARTEPVGKASSIIRVRLPFMKLPLSSLLFVFLADELDQTCATPGSLRRCTWSVATCTVEQFPIERQDPKARCQKGFRVIVE